MKDAKLKSNHEALYYHVTENGVQCDLCPHACSIGEGRHGICHSRVNHEGKLISEVYGLPCVLNIDPIEKKPLYHFLPGTQCLSVATTGCNLSCKNCQNFSISQCKVTDAVSSPVSPQLLVQTALHHHVPSIAYTYTEPLTYYEYTLDTAIIAHENKIRNCIVSAGYINREPLKQLVPYIDAANIDLKSFDDNLYKCLNKATLQPVLNTLETLLEHNVWLEITNLLIPSLNDSKEMLTAMCKWLVAHGFENSPLHFSRFFPMYKLENIPATPIEKLIMAHDIARDAGMNYVYIGNVGEVSGENTYCHNCKTLLIERGGYTIIENKIVNGTCYHCNTRIPGVW